MYQVPMRFWNEIAATQKLRHQSFKQLMALSEHDMLSTMDKRAKRLAECGIPDAVINAYERIAPLLAEHEAISRYIEHTGRHELRNALPEILSVKEAVSMASSENWLDAREKEVLMAMLVGFELANMRSL